MPVTTATVERSFSEISIRFYFTANRKSKRRFYFTANRKPKRRFYFTANRKPKRRFYFTENRKPTQTINSFGNSDSDKRRHIPKQLYLFTDINHNASNNSNS
jgi:hypothetical protein